ncbi:TonB-dependent receptor [Elizabethkingia anophelis]|nr:TonB-dependent receptor [Elizabethkingia anophelis]
MKKLITLAAALTGLVITAQETKTAKDTLQQSKEIQEVILKSQRKKQFVDKAVYTFGEDALKQARYANDLLKTLPELQFDPISNSVASIKGGKILLLINGVEATEMQVRTIKPEDVIKVEYYDNPPTRWATRADTVVNILTRNPETGYVFGLEASSALNTGFVNGSAYANYTKGRNNLGMDYTFNLRDYDNRRFRNTYDYMLNDSHYSSEENRKDHFGYTSQGITLRYNNILTGNYAFQAKLNLDILTSFSKANGFNAFTKDASTEEHGTLRNTSSDYNKPTIDLYFSKNLGKKDELSVNFVGSKYTTNSAELAKEWILSNNQSVFNNDMNLKAKQTSLVGEIAHTHDFSIGKLSSGYRISNNAISNDLQNLQGTSYYEVNYLEQYFYTEFSGKKNKLMYRVGLGLTNIHNQSAEITNNEWTITPKLILGYQLTKNQSLRFTSSYAPKSPSSSALSSNVVQVVPNIVRSGNPYLKTQRSWGNNLIYSMNNKYFDINANLFFWHRDRAINQMYVADPAFGGYTLTYENAQYSQQYGMQLTGSVKPFGNNLLVVKVVFSPATERFKTSSGAVIKNDYVGNYFVISSEYKSFNIQYQYTIPYYTLNGAFLSTNENANHIFVNYKHKNWSFSTGMYWWGMPSEYKSKTLPESLVSYTGHTQIFNNKSMFILGIGYDFAKGRKNEIQKKLNNDTAPPATF